MIYRSSKVHKNIETMCRAANRITRYIYTHRQCCALHLLTEITRGAQIHAEANLVWIVIGAPDPESG